ncbi:hypothetical protein SAMN05216570_0839 [Dyella sp. OK004]|uniref:hypothetical protein n=1 Tax=Dyella sp. OK004 TaxID=1855292 RepID=UPI0008EF0A32|nr:hypothetical protein [Dyella sp. OK004]SFR93497.1 hypothetical protein SAMN05216570_0839 [Dyella sp. OK004]
MNRAQLQRTNLPWLAAATAVLIAILPFLFTLKFMLARRAEGQDPAVLWIMLATFGSGLLFKGWVAFLIAQWRGERRGELAFRRPALLMLAFAVGLLVWIALTTLFYQVAFVALHRSGGSISLMNVVSTLLTPLLNTLGIWLAWSIATRLLRNDVLPPLAQPNMAPRIAGLAALGLAVVLLCATSFALPTLTLAIPDAGMSLLAYWSSAILPVVLAFVGALLGLRSGVHAVYGGRMLGATLAAMVSAGLLSYGCFVLTSDLLVPQLGLSGGVAATLCVIVLLAGIVGSYGLWMHVFYRSVRRGAAAGTPPPLHS